MSSESALRKLYAQRIRGYDPLAHVRQIENAAGSGEPDTYVCSGGDSVWTELKYIDAPVRKTTKIRCRHVRTSQLLWAADHLKAGGIVWFLVQVGKDYYLLTPRVASALRSGLSRDVLEQRACGVWHGALPEDVFLRQMFLKGNLYEKS